MRWGESTNGPDWTDIAVGMAAVQDLYKVNLALVILADGSPVGVPLVIGMSAQWPQLSLWDDLAMCAAHAEWPNKTQATMEGTVFGVLYKLEEEIVKQQEGLKEKYRGATRGTLTTSE